jgi:hypothetical protein
LKERPASVDFEPYRFRNLYQIAHSKEPIRKLLESDEADMIPYQALDSLGSARCGNLNTAVARIALAFVTRVI